MSTLAPSTVMPGLVPAIHVFFGAAGVRVDARDKPRHDGSGSAREAKDPKTGELVTIWEAKR